MHKKRDLSVGHAEEEKDSSFCFKLSMYQSIFSSFDPAMTYYSALDQTLTTRQPCERRWGCQRWYDEPQA